MPHARAGPRNYLIRAGVSIRLGTRLAMATSTKALTLTSRSPVHHTEIMRAVAS